MERRVLIAVFLSFLVLYGYQALFAPPPPPPASTTKESPARPAGSPPAATAQPAPAQPSEPAPALVTGDTSEREIVVETATVHAVFSNRGARIIHWQLK